MSDMSVGMTGDPEIDALLAGGPVAGFAAPEEPLGGYYGGDADLDMGPGGIPYAPGQAPTVYLEGDQFALLKALPLEKRVLLQEQLVALGLASKITAPGELDDATLSGMKKLLSLANRAGERWESTLQRLTKMQADGLIPKGGVDDDKPEPYLAPDYATLSQKVKGLFRDQLGRDPDEYEMQQLSQELSGLDMLAYERQRELDEVMASGTLPEDAPLPGTAVDPMARFAEAFEKRYKPELDFVAEKAETKTERSAVERGVASLSNAIGG